MKVSAGIRGGVRSKQAPMRLEGRTVILRPIDPADLERWRAWVNDPEIASLLDRALPVSAPEHEHFFETAVVGNERAVWFALERPGSPGDYIGNVWLWDVDPRHRRAEVRILIGAAFRVGNGGRDRGAADARPVRVRQARHPETLRIRPRSEPAGGSIVREGGLRRGGAPPPGGILGRQIPRHSALRARASDN